MPKLHRSEFRNTLWYHISIPVKHLSPKCLYFSSNLCYNDTVNAKDTNAWKGMIFNGKHAQGV